MGKSLALFLSWCQEGVRQVCCDWIFFHFFFPSVIQGEGETTINKAGHHLALKTSRLKWDGGLIGRAN